MTLLSYRKERGIAKGFALPFAHKLSIGLYLLFLNIRRVIYSFGKEPLFAMREYQRPVLERLWESDLGNRPFNLDIPF